MKRSQKTEEFLQSLRQKHGPIPVENYTQDETGANLSPNLCRDFSDHFDITVDDIRSLSAEELFLVWIEYSMTNEEPLPFTYEQALTDMDAEVVKAGGVVQFFSKAPEEDLARQQKPILPFKKDR